jgi:hypothetical protein
MNHAEDQRGILDEAVFVYQQTKDGKVLISWQNKLVKILKGAEADKFLKKITDLDEKQTQLALAKITGNFKRGNERR